MEPGIIILLGIIALVLALVWEHHHKKRVLAAWTQVAERLGLTVHGKPESMSGEVDGHAVFVRTFTTGSGKNRRRWTEVTCTPRPSIDAQIGADGFFRRVLDLDDVEVGDPAFDRALRVRGADADLLAVLDEGTRDAVRSAVGLGWTFDRGTWKRKVSGYATSELDSMIERAVSLGRRFAMPASERPARLRQRATSDPFPKIRRRALELLVPHAAGGETRAALATAVDDPDPGVRLVAALALGDVTRVAPLVQERDDAVALAALAALAERFPDHPASAAALDALRDAAPRRAWQVRARLLDALAQVRRPWAEAHAIEALGDEEDDVRLAAARALGQVGTIARAVPALVPHRDKFLGGAVKDAARDAILAIQARAGSPDAGRLAVVDEVAAGQLSLAAAEEEA
ncbi:MAG: HEAT repeat domain-containing protein [Deltaproteobacteria bacterium]|nr:HEAT repeat domain-containing protein [Deltaproteobacteria bacterium]